MKVFSDNHRKVCTVHVNLSFIHQLSMKLHFLSLEMLKEVLKTIKHLFGKQRVYNYMIIDISCVKEGLKWNFLGQM